MHGQFRHVKSGAVAKDAMIGIVQQYLIVSQETVLYIVIRELTERR